jgi:hypothetical protein
MAFIHGVSKAGIKRSKVKRKAQVRALLNLMFYFASSMNRSGNGFSELGRCSSSELDSAKIQNCIDAPVHNYIGTPVQNLVGTSVQN